MYPMFVKLLLVALLIRAGNAVSDNSEKDGVSNATTEGVDETGEGGKNPVDISKLSIKQICVIAGLPLHNCTCENLPMFCPKTYHFECSTYYDTIEGAVKICAAILGILGNLIILVVFSKNWKTHGHYRKLIALLAFYDFSFSVLILITSVPLIWTCKWLYGFTLCKLLRPMLNLGSIVALGVIVIISIERYQGIVNPFARKTWYLNVWVLNVGNMIVSLAIVFPMFFTLEIDRDSRCEENWGNLPNGALVYSWFLFVFVFLVPMVFMCVLYSVIIKSLHQRLKKTSGFLTNSERQKLQRNREFRKVLNILMAILVAYFILVFPNRIIWVILEHVGDNISKSNYRVLKYLALFPYLFHVSVNVFIYSAIDGRFKKEVRSLVYGEQKTRTDSSSSINTVMDVTKI